MNVTKKSTAKLFELLKSMQNDMAIKYCDAILNAIGDNATITESVNGERITFSERIKEDNYPEINMDDFLDVMKGGKVE